MTASEFSDVFVSYRRKDVEFVKQLVADLQKHEKEVWVDWEDIPPGVEGFADEIKRGLEGADAFIAVLSPNYLESTYCVDMELSYAVQLNKKIIPIVLEKFDGYDIPKGIGHINWIYFTPHAGQENDYAASFPKIMDVMHTDLEHVRLHKRFLLRAIEWQTNHKAVSFLMTGDEIDQAQAWLTNAVGKDPLPTDLHKDYINSSLMNQKRRQRILFAGVLFALMVSIALAILSLIGFNNASIAQAEAETNEALAQTAQAEAESNEAIAQTAQAEAETNEALAQAAKAEAENNLRNARQSQALFHGDLAKQQAARGLYQRSLLLGLEALQFHTEGIVSDSGYESIHHALHQPVRELMNVNFVGGISGWEWSADGQHILITGSGTNPELCGPAVNCSPRIDLWNVVTQEQVASLVHDYNIVLSLWSEDESKVLTLSRGEEDGRPISQVTLWNIADSAQVYTFTIRDDVNRLMWDESAPYFVVHQQRGGECGEDEERPCEQSAVVYDVATGDVVSRAVIQGTISDMYLSPDGQTLVLVAEDPLNSTYRIQVHDVVSGEPLHTLPFNDTNLFRQLEWIDGVGYLVTNSPIENCDPDAPCTHLLIRDVRTAETVAETDIRGTAFFVIDQPIIVDEPAPSEVRCAGNLTCGYPMVVRDPKTGEIFQLLNHRDVQGIEILGRIQDGSKLLTAGFDDTYTCRDCDTTLFVWSLDTGELLHSFTADGVINSLDSDIQLSVDETQMITISEVNPFESAVQVWDINSGENIQTLDLGNENEIYDVQLDHSLQHLIVTLDKQVEIYDASTLHLEHTLSHQAPFYGIKLFHDEQLIVTWAQSGDLIVWQPLSWGQNLKTTTIRGDVAYNYHRTKVVSWSGNDTRPANLPHVLMWDVVTGELLLTLETDTTVHRAVWNHDESLIAVIQREPNCSLQCSDGVLIFDAETGERVGERFGFISTINWMPDDSHLIVAGLNSSYVWDVVNDTTLFESEIHAPALHEWNRDFSMFVSQVRAGGAFRTEVVAYPSGDIVHELPVTTRYADVDWVNDNQIIALLVNEAEGQHSDLIAFDLETGEEVYELDDVDTMSASTDGTKIGVFDETKVLHMLDAITGDTLWTFTLFVDRPQDLLWSPDDSKLVLPEFLINLAYLINAETGELMARLPSHEVIWNPNSTTILVHDENTNPEHWRVYDTVTGDYPLSFQYERDVVWDLDGVNIISPDGIWHTDYATLVEQGQSLKIRDLRKTELEEFFLKPPEVTTSQ